MDKIFLVLLGFLVALVLVWVFVITRKRLKVKKIETILNTIQVDKFMSRSKKFDDRPLPDCTWGDTDGNKLCRFFVQEGNLDRIIYIPRIVLQNRIVSGFIYISSENYTSFDINNNTDLEFLSNLKFIKSKDGNKVALLPIYKKEVFPKQKYNYVIITSRTHQKEWDVLNRILFSEN